MATIKSAYDFLAADEKTALDYVDIFLPDNLEDQLSEKIDNPFYVVDGCYDPSNDTDISTLKSAIEEMLSNYFSRGRFPVKTNVVAGGGHVFPFSGISVLRPIYKELDMKYTTSDGLSTSVQMQYQLESQNRLLKLEDCLPSRKITRVELQDLYFKNTSIYAAIPVYLNKLSTVDGGQYGEILNRNARDYRGRNEASKNKDNSHTVKFISFPIGIRRNTNKGKGANADGSMDLKLKITARPYNNMLAQLVSEMPNGDNDQVNGVKTKTVRFKLKEVYGTASDIFSEMGKDGDVSAAADAIKIVFPEGGACVVGEKIIEKGGTRISSGYSAKIKKISTSGVLIYMDVIVPIKTYLPNDVEFIITTGSTTVFLWSNGVNVSPFGGALSGLETLAASTSDKIGQLTVPSDDGQFLQVLSGNSSIIKALAYSDIQTKIVQRLGSSVFCEQTQSLSLGHIEDFASVSVVIGYNPYDVYENLIIGNSQNSPITDGMIDANKLRIADNRIALSSDIFDIFGIDIRIELDE